MTTIELVKFKLILPRDFTREEEVRPRGSLISQSEAAHRQIPVR